MKEQVFTGRHALGVMTVKKFRRELRALRTMYPDIDSWECWYDGGDGTARWDGEMTLADVVKELLGGDPDALVVVEEHDGWQGACEGFRYIPEERCVIMDYNVCLGGGIPDDEEESHASDQK